MKNEHKKEKVFASKVTNMNGKILAYYLDLANGFCFKYHGYKDIDIDMVTSLKDWKAISERLSDRMCRRWSYRTLSNWKN